ncbi:hypothetical protein CANMA_005211 [Candida margitis]|uniref:uncharacterized protein n=1 Tax=Candida margitis TaxID=1775924 RepID=UPI002227A289|nr:uncharacterized protein CANMA_005211 [Candida margitis]KAI5950551.1 hypothetical protein CANMA_005211 [Candida margitis]
MSSQSRYTPNRFNASRSHHPNRGSDRSYSSNQQNFGNQNRGFKRRYNSPDSVGYSNTPSASYRARQNLYQQHATSKYYENSYQMWMGDLDPSWTEEFIHSMWSSLVTPPKAVKIMRDRLNPSKPSYSFVTFQDQETLDLALQRNGQLVPNSHRKFKLSHASAKNNAPTGAASGSTRPTIGEFSLFVGDIASDVSETALYSKFNLKYPNQIKSARVIVDQETKIGKGFGFVKFFTGEIMEKALKEMQGVMLGSKAIRVGIAAGSETSQSSSLHNKPDYKKIPIAQSQPELDASTDENNTSISICGLSSKFTESELESLFLAFGDLIYCKLSRDLQTGYVKFLLRSAAEAAMAHLCGSIISDCRLELAWGSSTKVEDGPTKFEPKLEGSYEPSEKPPLLYKSNQYRNKKLYLLPKDDINAYATQLDGGETMSTQQVNDMYLENKMARESV